MKYLPARRGAIAASAEWRPVVGYEGLYEVSSLGEVRSLDRMVMASGKPSLRHGRLLKPQIDRYGYATFLISRDGQERRLKGHRLVCEAFHGPPPPRFHAGHLDHNKLNNTPDNLAWISHTENARQNVARGIRPSPPKNPPSAKGEQAGNAKLTEAAVREMRVLAANGTQGLILARRFSISRARVSRIINRKAWRHVA